MDASRQNQSFGGFKKGFLLSSAKQPASKESKQLSSAKAEALEEIKKSNHSKAKDPLVFDEVQETLASQMPLLKSKGYFLSVVCQFSICQFQYSIQPVDIRACIVLLVLYFYVMI